MPRPPPRPRGNNMRKDSVLWTVGRPRSPPLFPVVANIAVHNEDLNENNDEEKGDDEDNNDDDDFENNHDEEHNGKDDKDSDSEYVDQEKNDDDLSDDDGEKVPDEDRLKLLSELMDSDLLEDHCEPQS